VEGVVADREFWAGKRVFLTGHTGFKGSWLAQLLISLGAEVTGYALAPPSDPNLFDAVGLASRVSHREGDIRDPASLVDAMRRCAPDIVFHLAAQALVRPSYLAPRETFEVNVMGTVNLFEAVRACSGIAAVVNVTSDKCYENREWVWGYREGEPLGGHDPYSASKACAEIVSGSYTKSFFTTGTPVASARAGNVIGGGDWAGDRLIPDLVRGFATPRPAQVRNPSAIRPWQHVLDALSGYLRLAERLAGDNGQRYAGAWNFGPDKGSERTVGEVAACVAELWGGGAMVRYGEAQHGPHEATFLKLDTSKARSLLSWWPKWDLDEALHHTVEWYRVQTDGAGPRILTDLMDRQIAIHQQRATAVPQPTPATVTP
jgi:CDP-glucose 4,6-dehydratase